MGFPWPTPGLWAGEGAGQGAGHGAGQGAGHGAEQEPTALALHGHQPRPMGREGPLGPLAGAGEGAGEAAQAPALFTWTTCLHLQI